MPQNIPVDQLNSLPLVTAESISEPGEVTVVGSVITRFFNNQALGFPPNFITNGTESWLISNQLDLRGTPNLTVLLQRFFSDPAGDVASTVQLYLVTDMTTGLTPIGAGGVRLVFLNRLNVSVTYAIGDASGVTFAAYVAQGSQIATGPSTASGAAPVGDRVRLAWRQGSAANSFQSWGGQLWAAGP